MPKYKKNNELNYSFFYLFFSISQSTSGTDWIFLQYFKKCNHFKAHLNLQFGLKICHLSLEGQLLCFFLPLKFSQRNWKPVTGLSMNDDQFQKPCGSESVECVWEHFCELSFHRILLGNNERLMSHFSQKRNIAESWTFCTLFQIRHDTLLVGEILHLEN